MFRWFSPNSVLQITAEDSLDFGKFCGDKLPLPVFSLSGTITLHFHTDADEEMTGFKARFSDSDGRYIAVVDQMPLAESF